jgi:hypothetical protein
VSIWVQRSVGIRITWTRLPGRTPVLTKQITLLVVGEFKSREGESLRAREKTRPTFHLVHRPPSIEGSKDVNREPFAVNRSEQNTLYDSGLYVVRKYNKVQNEMARRTEKTRNRELDARTRPSSNTAFRPTLASRLASSIE